jgi:hypothetical protein
MVAEEAAYEPQREGGRHWLDFILADLARLDRCLRGRRAGTNGPDRRRGRRIIFVVRDGTRDEATGRPTLTDD